MTVSQKAMIEAQLDEFKHGGDRSKTAPAVLQNAAKAAGISEDSISSANVVKKAATDH